MIRLAYAAGSLLSGVSALSRGVAAWCGAHSRDTADSLGTLQQAQPADTGQARHHDGATSAFCYVRRPSATPEHAENCDEALKALSASIKAEALLRLYLHLLRLCRGSIKAPCSLDSGNY